MDSLLVSLELPPPTMQVYMHVHTQITSNNINEKLMAIYF